MNPTNYNHNQSPFYSMKIPVNRKQVYLEPDGTRVIARLFYISEERCRLLIEEILAMPEEQVQITLRQVLREFAHRHRNLTAIFMRHFQEYVPLIAQYFQLKPEEIEENRQLLIGAYFTHEYSIEAAAFFNPSMVEAPDQTGLVEGETRYILSMRATGEGHISSIEFRHVVLDGENNLFVTPPKNRLEEASTKKEHIYKRDEFIQKVREMDIKDEEEVIASVCQMLPETFDYEIVRSAIETIIQDRIVAPEKSTTIQELIWLVDSHYELQFSLDTDISERIIFPVSKWENRGVEDARFVKFTYPTGRVTYYATYTAYDGFKILPKLIKTDDFINFSIKPLYGKGAQNKNLALFPRKINNKYAMLARIDGRNNYIMFSDRLTVWEEPILLQTPQMPWEYMQIGNCGSPIETPEGWLLLTHGVGPMRTYSIGAILLDLEDPSKVIGQLQEPLLTANEEEREGYVPNVVYSCGSIIHKGELVVPYAMSDQASSFVTVSVQELLDRLLNRKTAVNAAENGSPAPARTLADSAQPSGRG